jgi:glucose/arabinose dehydrogenase
MRALRRAACWVSAVVLVLPAGATAQVRLTAVGTFTAPTYLTAPAGDTHRIFVVERGGTIRIVRDGVTLATPFLDLGALPTEGERGLLSMAFAPDYATSGLFYVYFTAPVTGALTIQERRRDPADPERADPAFARTLLSIPHDARSNHNGGQLQFGPDGMLYAATGDGGGGGDPADNGQNLTSRDPPVVGGVNHDPLLGKLLRLDPSTGGAPASNPFPAPAREVWAYGLRNPWRFSFDRASGDLVVADVGQNAFEEVDVARAATGGGRGANFGWKRFEGLHTFPGGAPVDPASQPAFAFPAVEESHAAGWCSITGGYVVRDPELPELAGQYVFGDFCRGELNAVALGSGAPRSLGLSVAALSSFGEDACGHVYAVSLDGPVFRLESTAPSCGAATPAAGAAAPAGAPAAAADVRAPALTLRAARGQRVLRKGFVALRVRCDERCVIGARGTVLIARRRAAAAAAPRIVTRTVRRPLAAGRPATLRLALGRAARGRIRRALARPRRTATVRIAVTATDAARNVARRTARVRIVL